MCADVPLPSLKAKLEESLGPVELDTEPSTGEELASEDGAFLVEHAKKSYLLDGEGVLLGTASPDTFVNLSRELDCTIVYFVAQRMMGISELVVAKSGKLVRAYYTEAGYREPFSRGEPLASESETPLHVIYDGVLAAAESLGFPVIDVMETTPGHRITSDNVPPSESAWATSSSDVALNAARSAHNETHSVPVSQLKPQVDVVRGPDRQVGVNMRLASPAEAQKPAATPAGNNAGSPRWVAPVVLGIGFVLVAALISRCR